MNWILVSLKIEVVVMSCCLCALLTTVAVFKNRKKCLCLKPYTLYSSRQKERNFKNRGSVLVHHAYKLLEQEQQDQRASSPENHSCIRDAVELIRECT